MKNLGVLLLITVLGHGAPTYGPSDKLQPPALAREFRGAWIATVHNIDWPSKPGLSTAQQQQELRAIIERGAQLQLNALIFQVRPACDALYDSQLEPWSEFLTGKMGQAPEPFWDPLAFAVSEAHARGLELHAWFNPFRVRFKGASGPAAASHISRTQPAWVKTYGGYQWLDPAEAGAQAHSLAVILDVARRYDVDGLHIDDYFYPYPVKDAQGKEVDFPDQRSWEKYRGKLSRADWRRENINRFVQTLYTKVKQDKPSLKVGISPFGIWRPGHPKQIQGLDAYESLYADARLWLRQGWLDYCAPQLYWSINAPAQSYPVLLRWWAAENTRRRHLWPGINSAKVEPWKAEEIVQQIELARREPNVQGAIHWNMSALMKNRGGLATELQRKTYQEPALVPASPWLDDQAPAKPLLSIAAVEEKEITLAWRPPANEVVARWVIQVRTRGQWQTVIAPAAQTRALIRIGADGPPDAIGLTAIDRAGNASPASVFRRK